MSFLPVRFLSILPFGTDKASIRAAEGRELALTKPPFERPKAAIIIMFFLQPREEIQSVGDSVLYLNNWVKHKDGHFYFGAYFTEWRLILCVLIWTLTCTASIGIVYWCEKKMVMYVKQLGKPTHGNTQRLHKEFHRALLAMAITPLLTTTVPVLYFVVVIALQLSPGRVAILTMSIGVTTITLFNPLTTIMFLRCYRQATIKMFTCGWRKNLVNRTVAWASNISSNAVAANKPALEIQPVSGVN
ncbi:serpentine type 7TM GPCR chemoreceptor str domain-containing protein [Ditylenchus destructor]|nr:serpentine type 7TM GPCR chemoreceptor str domain-containing protein [Ditylenchus destructor]